MERSQPMVLVALGSNIDPRQHLPWAARLLAERVEVRAASTVYSSPPVGAPGSPEFFNAVLLVSPRMGPRSLKFGPLREVEELLGRRRRRDRNAPRTIDLDLLLFGDRVERAWDLELPDPELVSRAHLAVPAADVAGQTLHPVTGMSLSQTAARLESRLVARPDILLIGGGLPGC